MNGGAFIGLRAGSAQVSWTSRPVLSVLLAFSAVLLTTVVLLVADAFVGADETTLAFIYLLPVVVMALHYGSTIGVMTSFGSALAAAYFFFPPKFSFFLADRLHVAELGFFLLLAFVASKAIEVVRKDGGDTIRRIS
jgi:two-component system, OmpR family, sensor histidine kinase KdpD